MEPKNGRLKQSKTKTMTRISTQKTNASNDNSNGRSTRNASSKSSSAVFAPLAPPRLTSRKGGGAIRGTSGKQTPKR